MMKSIGNIWWVRAFVGSLLLFSMYGFFGLHNKNFAYLWIATGIGAAIYAYGVSRKDTFDKVAFVLVLLVLVVLTILIPYYKMRA